MKGCVWKRFVHKQENTRQIKKWMLEILFPLIFQAFCYVNIMFTFLMISRPRKVFGRKIFPCPHLKVPIWFGRLCLLLVLFFPLLVFRLADLCHRSGCECVRKRKMVREAREQGRSNREGKTRGTNELPKGEDSPLAFHRHVPSLRVLFILLAISRSLALSYWWPYTLFSGSSSGDDTNFCNDPHLMGFRLSVLLPEGYAHRS